MNIRAPQGARAKGSTKRSRSSRSSSRHGFNDRSRRRMPPKVLLSRTRHVKRNVKRWRGGQMMLRWVAAGVTEAVKGFRRLKGCADMPRLVAALVPAINDSVLVSQCRTSRRISTEPPPNFNSGRGIPMARGQQRDRQRRYSRASVRAFWQFHPYRSMGPSHCRRRRFARGRRGHTVLPVTGPLEGTTLRGDGWSATLNSGWVVRPAARPRYFNYSLARTNPPLPTLSSPRGARAPSGHNAGGGCHRLDPANH